MAAFCREKNYNEVLTCRGAYAVSQSTKVSFAPWIDNKRDFCYLIPQSALVKVRASHKGSDAPYGAQANHATEKMVFVKKDPSLNLLMLMEWLTDHRPPHCQRHHTDP